MNTQLEQFARDKLKDDLAQLPECHVLFKRMYGGTGKGGLCVDSDLDRDINDVVDTMPAERLDWAMQQIENTIVKREKQVDPAPLRCLVPGEEENECPPDRLTCERAHACPRAGFDERSKGGPS